MTHVKLLMKWMFVFCVIGVGILAFDFGTDDPADTDQAVYLVDDDDRTQEYPIDMADNPAMDMPKLIAMTETIKRESTA